MHGETIKIVNMSVSKCI